MSVLKRQRERKKAEKAAAKREERSTRKSDSDADGVPVASRDDLAGYGLIEPESEVDESEH